MIPSGPRPWAALAVGAAVLAVGLLAARGVGLLLPGPAAGAALGYLAAAVVLLGYWRRRRFGAANLVTLARVVGTCWVIGLTLQTLAGRTTGAGLLVIIVIGSCCLILDGVDGRVARLRGETSAFGARFDMETDAALLLALSLAVPALGIAGWWVLAIGLMRYAYVAASRIAPRRVRTALRTPLPYRYSRKVVAVIQGVMLLIALAAEPAGVVGAVPGVVSLLLAGALASLCWSFGRDIGWQLRTGRG